MIRILHLNDPFNWGGLETWLMRLATSTAALGCQMDFLATTVDPAHQQTMRRAGSHLFFGPRPKLVVPYLRRIKEVLREHGPYDIVQSHFPQHTGLALREAWRAGVPIRVAHSHQDMIPLWGNLGIVSRNYMRLGRVLTRRYATAGLADSHKAAASLFGENWRSDPRWRVLYCGIDLAPFANQTADPRVRADLSIPSGTFVIGHTGRFTFEKNHEFILRVACEVVRRDSTALFLLVGDGPLREELRERAKALGLARHTRFPGNRADVPRLLKAMDAFVFPSLSEGLGLSVVEAQAAGLPCVVSYTVPEEADVVLPLVTRLSLQSSPALWAEKLLATRERTPLPKAAAWERVANSPFEMEISAGNMKAFYLEQHQGTCRRSAGNCY
jgi:glycosyltransferase involved in cell wall biosynthesis